jgi:hypothetical protein
MDNKYSYEVIGNTEDVPQSFSTKEGLGKHVELMVKDEDFKDGLVVYVLDRAFCFHSRQELKQFLQLEYE